MNMCEGHRHFCSNCGSGVDGKTSEFFDFIINLEKGKIVDKRTVICGRCQKSSEVKQMLAFVKKLQGLKAKSPPTKAGDLKGMVPGARRCQHCLKTIGIDTPHVELTSFYDVNHRRFKNKKVVLCKQCYDTDPKTKALWQYLAKIGKNPTFTPKVLCEMFDQCPMAEEPTVENTRFQCTGIACIDTTEGFKLVCNFAHPGNAPIQDGDLHLFGMDSVPHPHHDPLKQDGQNSDGSVMVQGIAPSVQSAEDVQLIANLFADFEKSYKEMKEAVDEIQDPGIQKFVRCMARFIDIYYDDVKKMRGVTFGGN